MPSNASHKNTILQKRYEGYLSTPILWKDNTISKLAPLEIISKSDKINIEIDEKLRLGKYVERLVSFELEQHSNISILAENIQIQQNSITLGELDFLILKNNKPVHLEVIYKFYLYDPNVGKTETEHFIGPNRKDALLEKLKKLKEKQLPILYNSACKPYLNKLKLNSEDISQQVYFKAQLFLPFSEKTITLNTLNNDCVTGFYIKKNELNEFQDCKFYIPQKIDWLVTPHTNVNWLNFNDFKSLTNTYHNRQFSPLCWVKFKNGEIKKMFFVWW